MSQRVPDNEPRVVFFDAIETLFSLAPLEEKLSELDLGGRIGQLFFAQMLRDAFALSASGTFHTVSEIARGTLTVLLASLGHKADENSVTGILSTFSKLPAHHDVKPALEKVKSSQCRVVLLTNGARANTEKLVSDNAIEPFVDDIVSVEDCKIWKPQRELYHQALRKHCCAPSNAVLIAAHAWDVHGAMCAGLHGIWVQRQESTYHPMMGKPSGQASDLLDAVELALEHLGT